VALASLEVTLRDDVPDKLDRIGKKIENGLRARLRVNDADHRLAGEVRRTGGIVAVDLALPEGSPGGYLADLAPKLRAEAVARGVLLRPLGPVLYAMPPACTTEEQCERIATVMAELALLDR
jgi:adenosylmethionine-8-amino-7-oxononanoate aminotransferase